MCVNVQTGFIGTRKTQPSGGERFHARLSATARQVKARDQAGYSTLQLIFHAFVVLLMLWLLGKTNAAVAQERTAPP